MQNSAKKYVIDTCSLTKLRTVYPADVFPGVWEKVSQLAEDGVLISVEDVLEELRVQDDEVADWAKERSTIFLPLDEQAQARATKILATHPNLIDLKKPNSSADPFVIASAMINSCIVVTEEGNSGGPNKSKIPDVCKHYDIKCIRLLDMLRAEGLKL